MAGWIGILSESKVPKVVRKEGVRLEVTSWFLHSFILMRESLKGTSYVVVYKCWHTTGKAYDICNL